MKSILWRLFVATNLQKAIQLYNEKQFPKAAKLLIKDKSPCKDSLKLLMMVEFDSGNHIKAIISAKKLLNKTYVKVYVKDACNTIRICCQNIKDKSMELEYTEKSVLTDSSESNVQAIYQLLLLYFQEQMFVKIEELAKILLQWPVCRASVTFILIELASKQGNKKLLIERLESTPDYYDEFNLKQFGVIIELCIYAKLFKRAEKTLKYTIDKFGCDGTPLKIAILLAQKNILGAKQYWQQHKHLLEPFDSSYFEAKIACAENDHNTEYLALTSAAEGKKQFDLKDIKPNDQPNLINLFNISLPKLSALPLDNADNFGDKNTFILGFPRSGTTLLDNILDTQSDMLVLSEKLVLIHLIKTFKTFKNYPLDIHKLKTEEIKLLRQRYFQHISEQGYELPLSNIIIEKDPHLTEALPFIKRIFPAAKIIITLRHPLDVCLSCFQSYFVSNVYNSQLVTMEDIVNRYIDVFTLLERYENELSIKPNFIRYEDLVTDIQGEMTKVFNYMKVKPNDDYLLFHEHADNKFVTSASRGQTNQPLYTSSMYKWKNYDDHLDPYKEKLRYFIEKFGYDV
ncbi:MAG: hypothetical protein ACI971_000993 [Colwellia sp.]|jgi:hypothetical protein